MVERDDAKRLPVGILTDRDIVRGQLAHAADLFCLTVGDVMTPQPLCLAAELSLTAAIEKLNEKAVRRAPLLDDSGALIGMVTLDDLLPAVARQLSELADLMGLQARREGRESSQARPVQPHAQVTRPSQHSRSRSSSAIATSCNGLGHCDTAADVVCRLAWANRAAATRS